MQSSQPVRSSQIKRGNLPHLGSQGPKCFNLGPYIQHRICKVCHSLPSSGLCKHQGCILAYPYFFQHISNSFLLLWVPQHFCLCPTIWPGFCTTCIHQDAVHCASLTTLPEHSDCGISGQPHFKGQVCTGSGRHHRLNHPDLAKVWILNLQKPALK